MRVRASERLLLCRQARRDCGDQRRRNISLLPGLQKLRKNILRLRLAAHARVGDGKAATRQMRCFLGFSVKRDRFREIAFLAIRGGKNRIQIKVIWIELKRPLTFNNCIIDAVVGQIGGGGDVANDRRDRI